METWKHGDMETWTWTWRHGNMDMETWKHGHGHEDIDMDMKTSTWT